MINGMISLAALASPLALALTVPPPPIVISPSPAPSSFSLLTWTPGAVQCGGASVRPVRVERPWLQRVYSNPGKYGPLGFGFDIDASGRPVGIHKSQGIADADDLAPALAVTRFAPGQPRTGCSIIYTPQVTAIADAPLTDLMAYWANPISGPLPREAWKRLHAGGTCTSDSAAGLRSRAFPDFRAIPAEPGIRTWSAVGYDIDESGKTVNVETMAGSGNAALDEASRKAASETRYWSGGLSGCRFHYWRAAAPMPAPPAPEEEAFRPASSTCTGRREWTVPPVMRFPEAYRRRAIEGWAVVTYDIAPWGQIDNVQVKASQPSEDFGAQAIMVLRSARVKPGAGAVGCVERVRFVMESEDPETAP
jgi:TonB family protein